ncbi:MAG: RAMP superfamily CRISPR-associated protein, partial [Planctomycetia bacterium]|nr:RAMP superfamily CRISPR-associated protein [Planctomycetia bacterium]
TRLSDGDSGQRSVFRLTIPLVFPAGLSSCSGSAGNLISLARDGQERVVLRGSSIAGVLRNLWRSAQKVSDRDPVVTDIFGSPAGDESPGQSPLTVPDVVLEIGKSSSVSRMCHARNRHTGSVLDGCLFEVESTPPGTRAELTLWLESGRSLALEFMRCVLRHLREGVIFGGNGNRGVGLARVDDQPDASGRRRPCGYRQYSLTDPEDLVAYLNDHRLWREGKRFADYRTLPEGQGTAGDTLKVVFTLKIPRGQDLLIAEGADMEPRQVTGADGRKYFVLPGSTLHGLFRSWCTRLAAREGKNVSDSVNAFRERSAKGDYTGEKLGDENPISDGEMDQYPIESMFGSLYRKGRLHISDAFSPVPENGDNGVQFRVHVAVDAISGGILDGLLFTKSVLTKGSFQVTLLLRNPQEDEVRWLVATLGALDQGLLRLGSGKAAGRVTLEGSPDASGALRDCFRKNWEKSHPGNASDHQKNGMEETSTQDPGISKVRGKLRSTMGRLWSCDPDDGTKSISIPGDLIQTVQKKEKWFRDRLSVVVTLDASGTAVAVERAPRNEASPPPSRPTPSHAPERPGGSV